MSTSLEQHFVVHASVLDLQSQDIHFFLSAVYHNWHFLEDLEKNYLLSTSKYRAFLFITITPILSEDLKGLRKWIFPPLFQLN